MGRVDGARTGQWTDSGAALHISTTLCCRKVKARASGCSDDPCRHWRKSARPQRRFAARNVPARGGGSRRAARLSCAGAVQMVRDRSRSALGTAALHQRSGPADRPGRAREPARAAAIDRAAGGQGAGGRERSRTLDLDIVAIGKSVHTAPDPVLPHPRAHLRAFVLVPLADVAPDWVHPVLGQGVRALIDALPPQQIRPI